MTHLRLKGHSKYKAVKTDVDGITFDSKREAKRYGELKLLEKAGKIHGLRLQSKFRLCVPARFAMAMTPLREIGEYRSDFDYCECPAPQNCQRTRVTVEDVKGFKTPLYRWKKKHMEVQYGIEIREI